MRTCLSAMILAALLGAAGVASAQELQLPKAEEPDTGTARPPAPDQRTGHIYASGFVGATGPAGAQAPNTATGDIAGAGLTAGGVLGVGVGRSAIFQSFGDYTRFASPGACSTGCFGRSFTVGLGFAYHLAQGLAFDPWASFGVAFRQSTFMVASPADVTIAGVHVKAGDPVEQRYRGIDIARIALGGEFYPTPWFGFGPFLEGAFGTNFDTPAPLRPLPPDVLPGNRAYAFFQIGARVTLDPMRRASAPARTAAQRFQLGALTSSSN